MAPDDDYLWDKRGTPDPEVERLERALGSLAHQERPLVLPEPAPAPKPRVVAMPPSFGSRLGDWVAGPLRPVLAAAAVAIVLGGGWLWTQLTASRGWEVASLEGAPRVAQRVLKARDRLAPGEWLTTDASSRARFKVGKIGVVEIEPDSRARLVAAKKDDQRLAMQVGGMRAIILAPP